MSVIVFMNFVLGPVTNYFDWVTPPEAPDRWAFLLGKPYLFLAYLFGVVWIGAAFGEETVSLHAISGESKKLSADIFYDLVELERAISGRSLTVTPLIDSGRWETRS